MARKKRSANLRKNLWMVTFSDLSMLLMALFVLLFSMSSIDSGIVERISSRLRDESTVENPGKKRVDSRLETLLELLKDSRNLQNNQAAIKELLFPDDILPPELDKGMLKDNVMVVSRESGVAIILSEDLLFEPGQSALSDRSQKILQALSPLLRQTGHDIIITGHSDEQFFGPEHREIIKRVQYQLSGLRALAVLELYLDDKIEARRFSVAGYGSDRPLTAQDAAQAGAGSQVGNRRVEIIIKSAQEQ